MRWVAIFVWCGTVVMVYWRRCLVGLFVRGIGIGVAIGVAIGVVAMGWRQARASGLVGRDGGPGGGVGWKCAFGSVEAAVERVVTEPRPH